ncbi:ABC-type Fe3+/spermidine/putrescine transport system ATPase subunit [Paenibacillus aceris]|uniref:ABC-type Fe3+/spermidine/putrescine transport system ATPase subunit n=2 Tax=Paenibacillus aceris TaxID=869555 RepID=A0ABS4HZK4_9BACL|nr:ABC transporter ATP-binding protein [Paenibacillus aceris]MBP1963890.1 ABC-type Fe3+/spermidine/putrescine transport system ATPase subunit [Paenibacillus aceris]
MSSQVLLDLKNVSKVFGSNHVLKQIDLQIERGKFITFLGPSGCGKTTLLRSIAGFYTIDEGEIKIDGQLVNDLPPYKRGTPMVFQEYALFPHMTVFDNVAYGLDIQKRPEAEVQERVKTAMAKVKLTGLEERYPHEMSGGQQQRVAMARALVMNSPIILLDEPLSNLDAKLREEVRVELRSIQQELGLTVIYVTHDQLEALSMSDSIVVFNKGAIDQYGTPHEIYYKPRTPYVADFIGTTNFVDAIVREVANGKAKVDYGTSGRTASVTTHEAVTPGDKVLLSIRPESMRINAPEAGTFLVSGFVKSSMFLGEKERYFILDDNMKEWIVDAYDIGLTRFQGNVTISAADDKIHLIKKSE